MLYQHLSDMKHALEKVVEVDGNDVRVIDSDRLRHRLIDELVYNAMFHSSDEVRYYMKWLIREAAAALVIYPASIHDLYALVGKRKTSPFTTPAVNIRALTYDVARAYFRAARTNHTGAFIFEIAKSEMGYTDQLPLDYATCILAAAIKERHQGPVFMQGDHFQVNAANFKADRTREMEGLMALIDDAIVAGFFNIDIDSSTLVDLSREDVSEQQELNYSICAELADYIRGKEPAGVTIAIGGEIGEVGATNSTVEEFRAFMDGFTYQFRAVNETAPGICKISVQTGTEHGGVPAPEGGVEDVELDFKVLLDIGEVARRDYGVAGTVQHGASTLPDEMFDQFPRNSTCEIHLATGFQNMILDHDAFPTDLKEEMYTWVGNQLSRDRKPGQTDEQFYYQLRKKAIGPFKQRMWDLPQQVRDAIMEDVEARFSFYMEKLQVKGTSDLVRDSIRIHDVKMPAPVSGYTQSADQTMNYILSDPRGE